MPLSEQEKTQITKILKKTNKWLWKEPLIEKVIEIIEQVRSGQLKKEDYFVPALLNYEDYFYNLNLRQFI